MNLACVKAAKFTYIAIVGMLCYISEEIYHAAAIKRCSAYKAVFKGRQGYMPRCYEQRIHGIFESVGVYDGIGSNYSIITHHAYTAAAVSLRHVYGDSVSHNICYFFICMLKIMENFITDYLNIICYILRVVTLGWGFALPQGYCAVSKQVKVKIIKTGLANGTASDKCNLHIRVRYEPRQEIFVFGATHHGKAQLLQVVYDI